MLGLPCGMAGHRACDDEAGFRGDRFFWIGHGLSYRGGWWAYVFIAAVQVSILTSSLWMALVLGRFKSHVEF